MGDRIALALALCLLASPVAAQENCAPHKQVVAQLADQYGETLQSAGMAAGELVEVYASEASGTWTILSTDAAGKSCMIAAGDMWHDAPKGEAL